MGDFASAFAITPRERKAMAEGRDVESVGNGQNHLYAPVGMTLTQDADANKSSLATYAPSVTKDVSLGASGAVHPADRRGMQGTSAAQAASYHEPPPPHVVSDTRQPTTDELLAHAREMIDNQHAQTEGQLSNGPSTGTRNDAGGHVPEWLRREQGDM